MIGRLAWGMGLAYKTVLLTGYKGFIGQNIERELHCRNINTCLFDKEQSWDCLQQSIDLSDVILHQAAITDTLNHNNRDL